MCPMLIPGIPGMSMRNCYHTAFVQANTPSTCRTSRSGCTVAMATNADDVERLARAKGYPYPRPKSSFLFINGDAYTFDNSAWRGTHQIDHLDVLTPDRGMQRAEVIHTISSLNVRHALWHGNHTVNTVAAYYSLPPGMGLQVEQEAYTAVLAIASNAGPSQLRRKFPVALFPDGVFIPVLQAVLQDFDVVYAPLVSSYGSCTATLEYSPGTDVELFVTFLTEPLLKRMHETEGAYNACRLDDITFWPACDLVRHALQHRETGSCGDSNGRISGAESVLPGQMRSIVQYNHQAGTLHMQLPGQAKGGPVALAEIKANGRVFPSLTQIGMQHAVMSALERYKKGDMEASCLRADKAATDDELDSWILRNLDDNSTRVAHVQVLTDCAQPFQYEKSLVLESLGNTFSSNVK